jgi:cytochrome c biogenesis factor
MKKSMLHFAIVGVIVITGSSAFGQENKKAKEAREDVKEAQKDLRLAKTDSLADYNDFRKNAEIKIAENQKSIAELKAKKASENKETKAKYDKKVVALEQKNNELKKRMDGSASTETSAWTKFKREFNHDMTELGHSIKDIGKDNVK